VKVREGEDAQDRVDVGPSGLGADGQLKHIGGSPGVVGRRALILECVSVRKAPVDSLHHLADEVLGLELGGSDVLRERLPLVAPECESYYTVS
jgi:hypothetical protein